MIPFESGNYLVGKAEIICPYCDKLTGLYKSMLSPKHLTIHKKTIKDVKTEFPELITMTYEYWKTQQSRATGTKEVKCKFNDTPECCKEIITVKKSAAKYYLCDNCKSLGRVLDKRSSKEAYEKRAAGLEKKHGKGITNPRHIPGVIEKTKKTNEERYGGTGFASEELASQSIRTMQKNYDTDVTNSMHIKEIAKKVGEKVKKESNPERGNKISQALKGKDSKLKGRTYEDIHGTDKAQELIEKKKQLNLSKFIEKEFPLLLEYFDFKFIDEEYLGAHILHNFKCNKCGLIINRDWNSIQQGYRCPDCYPRFDGTSKGEKELFNFIKEILPDEEIIENTKIIIPPKELDIYIPNLNIAIEYNGLYYHSDASPWFIEPKYHLNKTNQCEEQGIRLIHIFEDEWVFKKDIVKERLKQILNIGDKKRIHARLCTVIEIDAKIKNEFLDKYHIQGKDSSNIKLGAFYNDELVSVMTFSKPNRSKGIKYRIDGVWELNRFCINYNYHIPGIASKLLSYFKKNYDWIEVYSYADRRWSIGDLYIQMGFDKEYSKALLNYWYVKNGKRIHRYALRKRSDEPKDISEKTLRIREGYNIIWDCGSFKFSLKNTN